MSSVTNTVFIKKYENRRLYNVNEKKYISLEDVRSIICEGHTIKVTEKKTGKDITKQVLFQVLMDMSPEKLNAFPLMFLHFLIKSDAPMLSDYFENFFGSQLSMYLNNRQKYLDGLNNMQKKVFGGANLFKNPFWGNFSDNEPHTEDPPEAEEKKSDDNNSGGDIDELKDMMSEISRKISELEKKNK